MLVLLEHLFALFALAGELLLLVELNLEDIRQLFVLVVRVHGALEGSARDLLGRVEILFAVADMVGDVAYWQLIHVVGLHREDILYVKMRNVVRCGVDIGDVDVGWCRVCVRYAIYGVRGIVSTVQREMGVPDGVYVVCRMQTERKKREREGKEGEDESRRKKGK